MEESTQTDCVIELNTNNDNISKQIPSLQNICLKAIEQIIVKSTFLKDIEDTRIDYETNFFNSKYFY